MKLEDKLLCACTRQNFLDTHRRAVLDIADCNELHWPTIYSTALDHGVAPLVFSNLRQCATDGLEAPQSIMDQFQSCFFRNMAVKEQWAGKLTATITYFQEKLIQVMLIKGIALDLLVYNHPYYTMSQDIDIILSIKSEALPDKDHKQIGDRLYGLGIEYDFFEHHDVGMNGILLVDFQQIWEDAIEIEFRGQAAWVMCPEDMLLSACINSCRKRFFKLKSLCDIAEIVSRYQNLSWDKLSSRARAYQCENIVYTALLVAKMTLGCQLPETIWGKFQINPVRMVFIRTLISYLSHCKSLSAIYPFGSDNQFGREINLSLFLPYITYRWNQVRGKMRLVYP